MRRMLYALLGLVLAVNIAACSSDSDDTGTAATTAPPAATEGTEAPAESTADHVVQVEGFAYSPASITISVGDTVEWVFADGPIQHDVVGVGDNVPDGFGSPLISEGTWSFTFDEAGTYEYFCSLHPQMLGTVIVE